jgi:cysteine synthase
MVAFAAKALAAGMAQASVHAVRHDEAAAMAHLVEQKYGVRCGTTPAARLAMADVLWVRLGKGREAIGKL